jgi:hypothetical protein
MCVSCIGEGKEEERKADQKALKRTIDAAIEEVVATRLRRSCQWAEEENQQQLEEK